jgi:hypothetical protein
MRDRKASECRGSGWWSSARKWKKLKMLRWQREQVCDGSSDFVADRQLREWYQDFE